MGISIGLVGLGRFGSGFADLFMKHPLVDRVALCDREPERVARFAEREDWKPKFRPADAYHSLDEICRSDLDALIVMTQPWLHAAQCVQALRSGKHVYSAVPIVSLPDDDETLDWIQQIVEACKETGLHYMLGETSYFRPQAMFCRKRAAAGDFGDFVHAVGAYRHDVDANCNLRDVAAHRAASAAGQEWKALSQEYFQRGHLSSPMHYPTHSTCGPVSVMNAHAIDCTCLGFRNRTGDPYFKNSAFSNQTALYRMSNGASVVIEEWREVAANEKEGFSLYGTAGSFEQHDVSNQFLHNSRGPGRETHRLQASALTEAEMRDPLPPEVEEAWTDAEKQTVDYGGHGGSHPFLVHEFVDAIAHGRRPAIHIWEAARYMTMGIAANQSSLRDGETVKVPTFGEAPSDS